MPENEIAVSMEITFRFIRNCQTASDQNLKFKILKTPKCWRGCKETHHSYAAGGNEKGYSHAGR